MLNYFLRKPKFPVICDFDGHVVAAKSDKSFLKSLSTVELDPAKSYNLVDSTAEGWVFLQEHMFISAMTFKKHWTKKEIIAMFNNRKNLAGDGTLYSEKSLSAKRFDRIFGDIVDLLLKGAVKP